jgi:nitroreductase
MSDEATRGIDLASVDRVVRSTRSVRRHLDRPVPADIIEEAIDVALQAPTGANSQGWRFVVVTDGAVRKRIGELYRRGSALYLQGKTGLSRTGMSVASEYAADDPRALRMGEVVKSAVYLIENIDRVPFHLIPCIQGRFVEENLFTQGAMWGSILSAAWSIMLALLSQGVASAWRTFTLLYEREMSEILGIPEGYTQAVLLPIAWLKSGDLGPAPRFSARGLTFWNRWGATR